MSLSEATVACARIVERADPVRFRTVMAAPIAARAPLFALYAFNAEVARAPWVTQEAMIAEMRLQWWRDALEEIAEGRTVRSHEVTTPLAKVLTPEMARTLDHLVAARRWDIYRDAFEDEAHFDDYLDATSGTLMWTAALTLGAEAQAEAAVRDLGYAAGTAAFLRAVPGLEAAGRVPLLDGTAQGVAALAARARDRVNPVRLRAAARPALWPAIGVKASLDQARRTPQAVADGTLKEAVPPLRLSLSALTGRVWL